MKKARLRTNSAGLVVDSSGGFSLVEILVAISVFLVFVLATTGVILTTSQNIRHTANSERATILAEEAIEASRNLRDANPTFATLPDGTYGLSISGNQWNLSGSSDTTGIFTRSITISTINGSQKKIVATVSWSDQVSQTNSVTTNTYLTDWRAPLSIGLTVDKSVVNHGGTKVPSDFLPISLTTLAWDNSVDPPVQNSVDVPIVFSPSVMTLGSGTYTFLTSNDPDYTVTLSSDCASNFVTLSDGDTKLCNITYEEYFVPTVTTPTHSLVTQTTATLGANVTSLGNPASISERGTCWDITPLPTANCVAEGGTTTGVFTQGRTGFSSNTTYYYRGYATNSKGTGYSDDGTFTTTSAGSLPTITTGSPVTSITRTTATGGGNVTSDGGATVTARGVVWSTSPNPTIALSTKTNDGTGTGSFSSSITGLTCNTLYYVRAYATNAVGTSYGLSSVTFTTAACSTVTFVASAISSGTTATVPPHLPGDLLIAFSYRDGNASSPALASGWTNISNTSGTNANGSRLAYRIATGSDAAAGWTNASLTIISVYRGQSASPIGATLDSSGAGTTVTYPALALQQTDSTSLVIGFAGHRSINTALETPPAGMTQRSTLANAIAEVAGHDTNIGVSSWGTTNVPVGGTSSGWMTRVLEIKSQ